MMMFHSKPLHARSASIMLAFLIVSVPVFSS